MLHSRSKINNKSQLYTYQRLRDEVNQVIGFSLRENPYEIVRTKQELEARLRFKKDLRTALKNCVVGDKNAKVFIKDFITEIIAGRLKLSEEQLNVVFPFGNYRGMTSQDKFDVLLYVYEKQYKMEAFLHLVEDYSLDEPQFDENGEIFYEISEEAIDSCYYRCAFARLSYVDKVNIIAQRIYQETRGNGAIDSLREQLIDGISGGVSGVLSNLEGEMRHSEIKCYSYQSVWVFLKGKTIYLSCLKFQSEKELIRICKNIYRYQNPGQLSEVKGYIVNEMADGSRVSVARPPFCENWVFFIRKFDSVPNKSMEQLITDDNQILPIGLLKWLVKGCQVIGITGEQGSGKTTLLMSLIRYMKPTFNLRVQELAFELNLRKIYPHRNIVSFRETNSITGQEGLDFQKKTDGSVNILGEVASLEVCSWLIQIGQTASQFTIFTHHAKTTNDLILAFRNALLQKGGFTNESAAEHQVVNVIRYDIHMKKADDGHRFIERITEILELEKGEYKQGNSMFSLRDLVVWKEGKYCIVNVLSESSQRRIIGQLSMDDKKTFLEQVRHWREVCEKTVVSPKER